MNKIEKFQHLITILENTPDENFDLTEWGNVKDFGIVKNLHTCGTVCCAVGWASLDEKFNKLGFFGNFDLVRVFCPVVYDEDGKYVEARGWEAVESFFEIDLEEAFHLFGYGHYPQGLSSKKTKRLVIERIQEYIDKGGMNA